MKKLLSIILLNVVAAYLFFNPPNALAYFIDLTPGPVVNITYDENIFSNDSIQPAGSGVLNPFVRISNSNPGLGDPNGYMQSWGYNTGFEPVGDFEFKNIEATDPFTRELLLSDVPIVEIDGTFYREFLLDINEAASANKKLLSVNQLQFYLFDAPDVNDFDSLTADPNQLVWDLDGKEDSSWIGLDYTHHSGSGESDMFAYINEDYFQIALSSLGSGFDYVYLFSHFGGGPDSEDPLNRRDWTEHADYEEWAVRKAVAPIPEPATMLLLGSGLIGFAAVGRKKFIKKK